MIKEPEPFIALYERIIQTQRRRWLSLVFHLAGTCLKKNNSMRRRRSRHAWIHHPREKYRASNLPSIEFFPHKLNEDLWPVD